MKKAYHIKLSSLYDRSFFCIRGQKRGKTFQDSSFTNKSDSANIIENDGKKGEFMIYFNVGPF